MQVVLHVLREIIRKEENGSFPNRNYFAIQVYDRIHRYGMDFIKSKRFIDDVPVTANDILFADDGEVIKTLEGHSVWDFRFRAFAVNGFRMFPFGNHGRSYGLSFERTAATVPNPCSLFLVGANGSGKTSLYSSMEYYCTGNVSAAISRGILPEHYSDYIAHAKKKEKPELRVFLQKDEDSKMDKLKTLQSLKEILPAFFCSEHEINEFCRNPQELTLFFYEQIGYGNIVRLKEHLEDELSIIKKCIENKSKDSKSEHEISPKARIVILEGIQSDILKFMNQERVQHVDSLHLAHLLLSRQPIEWIDEWDIKRKQFALGRIIGQLTEEKEEIVRYYGNKSTLYRLYNDYIAELSNILHSSQEVPRTIVPKRFQGAEQNYQLGKIQIEDFQAKCRIVLEWYIRISDQFISSGKDRDVIKIIREVSDVLAQIESTMDNVTETDESIRYKYQLHSVYLKTLIDGIEEELKKIRKVILENTERLKKETLVDFLFPSEEILFALTDDGKLLSTLYFKKEEKEKGISFDPKEYFNSFRYKFYCILLKIVAAFTVKKYFNFNFPLVFDDIFYSSDFSNRDKVGDFIASIYKVHNEIFEEIDSPLQIIFFTHDDLILEAAMKGTADFDNALYGRLFYYDEVQEGDVRKENGLEYYNLYLPFTE